MASKKTTTKKKRSSAKALEEAVNKMSAEEAQEALQDRSHKIYLKGTRHTVVALLRGIARHE